MTVKLERPFYLGREKHFGSILHNHALHSRRFYNFLEGSLALSKIEASKFLSWDKNVQRKTFIINTSSLAQLIRVFQTEFSESRVRPANAAI